MTILELIQAALAKAGVDKKYAERVQKLFKIEKDEDIDEFVSLFKDNVLPGIAEAEEAAKETARKEAVSEYETTHKLKDGKPVGVEKKDEIKIPETLDPAIKALLEKQSADIATLTGIVTGVVKTSTNAQKLEQVKAKLVGKVDAKFIDRVAGKVNLDASDLEAEINAHVTEFTEFKQSLITEFVGESYVPRDGRPAGEKTVAEWSKLMDTEGSNSTAGVVDLGLSK